MKALHISPNCAPCIVEISNGGDSYREILEGEIEFSCPYDDVLLVCLAYGKMMNMPFNRAIRNSQGRITDLVAGSFLVLGLDDEGGTLSMSEPLIEKYTEMFREPEKEDDIPPDEFHRFYGQYVKESGNGNDSSDDDAPSEGTKINLTRKVGEIFDPPRPGLNTMVFEARGECFDLMIFHPNPPERYIEAVKNADCFMGLTPVAGILFLHVQFAGFDLSDAPFHAKLCGEFDLSAYGLDEGCSVVVYLVDTATGILKAIRTLTFGSEFGEILSFIINEQLQDDDFDNEEYAQMINQIYSSLSSEEVFKSYSVYASRPTMSASTNSLILVDKEYCRNRGA